MGATNLYPEIYSSKRPCVKAFPHRIFFGIEGNRHIANSLHLLRNHFYLEYRGITDYDLESITQFRVVMMLVQDQPSHRIDSAYRQLNDRINHLGKTSRDISKWYGDFGVTRAISMHWGLSLSDGRLSEDLAAVRAAVREIALKFCLAPVYLRPVLNCAGDIELYVGFREFEFK